MSCQHITPQSNPLYVCLNKNCSNSYILLCSSCKLRHRDHAPFVFSGDKMVEALNDLIRSRPPCAFLTCLFRKISLLFKLHEGITFLHSEIKQETIKMIRSANQMMDQYHSCQTKANILLEQFKSDALPAAQLLENINYNQKRKKMEFNSESMIKEQKIAQNISCVLYKKIGEIQEYCVKFIQVALSNDSEGEENSVQEYQEYRNKIIQYLKPTKKEENKKKKQQKEKKAQTQEYLSNKGSFSTQAQQENCRHIIFLQNKINEKQKQLQISLEKNQILIEKLKNVEIKIKQISLQKQKQFRIKDECFQKLIKIFCPKGLVLS